MVMDRNKKFGADTKFAEDARRVGDFLWDNTGGDVTAFPRSYLENLRHDYADGRVSMLELMDRVDLGPDATYEEYCEVFDALLDADPTEWPEPDTILTVSTDSLLCDVADDFTYAEGGEDMAYKIEKFLKKVISAIYTKGVTDVTDAEGDPPGESNNYLLSQDGTEFHGVFHDRSSDGKAKEFPFVISENGGRWQLEY